MPASRATAAGAVAVVLGCAPPAPAPDAGMPPAAPEAAVRAARARWNAAVAARDTAAVRRLLAADSVVQATHRFVVTGADRYVAGLARQFARRPRFAFVYFPERVEASREGTLVTEYGRWRETWLEAGEPTELRGTYYVIWRERGGAWEIVRDTFAPHSCSGRRYCGR